MCALTVCLGECVCVWCQWMSGFLQLPTPQGWLGTDASAVLLAGKKNGSPLPPSPHLSPRCETDWTVPCPSPSEDGMTSSITCVCVCVLEYLCVRVYELPLQMQRTKQRVTSLTPWLGCHNAWISLWTKSNRTKQPRVLAICRSCHLAPAQTSSGKKILGTKRTLRSQDTGTFLHSSALWCSSTLVSISTPGYRYQPIIWLEGGRVYTN